MIHIVALMSLVWGTTIANTSECSVPTPDSFQLAINGRRNETGHWISQVSMEHNEDMSPWEVDVKKTIKECSGSQSVLLVVTLSETAKSLESLRRTQAVTSVDRNTSCGGRLEMVLLGYRHIPPFGYYKFYAEKQDWDSAKKKCEQEGAHLVIFNSKGEYDSVKLEFRFTAELHVGFHDKDEEGKFITVQGDPLESTGYANWARGTPNGSTGQNCGFVNTAGEIDDIPCSALLQFVCEM